METTFSIGIDYHLDAENGRMLPELKTLLDHLEQNLDPQREEAVAKLHRAALDFEPVERLPLVLSYPTPDDTPFKPFPHREIFDHPEKMLYNELTDGFTTSIALRDRIDDDLPCFDSAEFRNGPGGVDVRSPHRTDGRQSALGPRVQGIGRIRRTPCFATSTTSLKGGFPRRSKSTNASTPSSPIIRRFAKRLRSSSPDLQGPIDTADLLRGSEIYPDFHLSPELAKRGLEKITEAQIALANHLLPYTTDRRDGMTCQHATYMKGQILIRNDSAIMVFPRDVPRADRSLR